MRYVINMREWKIPNVGEIHLELMKDLGKSTEITEKLLKKIIEGIAIRSANYYKNTDGHDHLFTYSEKQLNTAICPAIANDISLIFKMELPIKRKDKKRRGNLDYWIFYNNIVFALELKLAHISYNSKDYTEKKSVFEKFTKALEQLDEIEEDKVLYSIKDTNRVIKIALEAIVFQKKSEKEININENELKEIQWDIEDKFNSLIKEDKKFDKEVNFKSVWFPEESLVSLKPIVYGEYRMCPALGFIGHVGDVITIK